MSEKERDRFEQFNTPVDNRWRLIAVVVAIAIGAFFLFTITQTVFVGTALLLGIENEGITTILGLLAQFVASVLLVALYLNRTDHTVDFLDLSPPSLREVGIAIATAFSVYFIAIIVASVGQAIGVSAAEHSALSDVPQWAFWILIPMAFLTIAPAEELIYRNIVQKNLYRVTDRSTAVFIASLLFASLHLPTFLTSTPSRAAISVLTVFILAMGLGIAYSKTDNLMVPIIAHGLFNAYQFLLNATV